MSNRHTAACSEPPAVDGDAPGTYVGYFAKGGGLFLTDWHHPTAKGHALITATVLAAMSGPP